MPENSRHYSGPMVSVIMPVFNSEMYLREAIESVLAQTYRPMELIIINDGSRDRSGEIARSYCSPDGAVRVIDIKYSGQVAARNRGISVAEGEFLAFIDSDDRWHPEKTSIQMSEFRRYPEAGVVYSQRENIDSKGKPIYGYQPPVYSGDVLQKMYIDNFVCWSSALVRKEVYERVGGFNEGLRMAPDFDFLLRAACFYPFRGLAEPLVQYRTHDSQLSRKTEERVRNAWTIRERFDAEFGRRINLRTRMQAKSRHFIGRATRAQAIGEPFEAIRNGCLAFLHYPFDIAGVKRIVKAVLPLEVIGFLKKHTWRRHA